MPSLRPKLWRTLWVPCVYSSLLTFAAAAETAVNPHAHEPIATVRQMYDGTLMPDLAVATFRNIDRLFPTRTVKRGPTVQALPAHERPLENVRFNSGGKDYDLYDYVSLNRVCALLILRDGKVCRELYAAGNTERTRWMSMSMVKSITATLIGAAIQDGHIKGIDDPVTTYLPRLKGSAYEGVTVRHVLQMASGVKWNETYTDPASDRRRLLEAQIAQEPGGALKVMAALPRAAAPGTRWNYSTGETQVAGALLRAAVGKPVAEYLSEKIWSKFGMESDATWWLESPDGLEIGGSGLSATLRDYARFGLFLLGEGKAAGQQVLPPGWVKTAGSAKIIAGQSVDYGYMLWPIPNASGTVHEGAFEARGIFGQHIYLHPRENVVVVVWSAQSKPTGKAVVTDYDFFGAVVASTR